MKEKWEDIPYLPVHTCMGMPMSPLDAIIADPTGVYDRQLEDATITSLQDEDEQTRAGRSI